MLTAQEVTYKNRNAALVKSLFLSSFPRAEQTPFWFLMFRSRFSDTEFISYWDEGVFCGAVFIIEHEKQAFVFYLAVNETVRSKGYGSQILADIEKRYAGRTLMLDIEHTDRTAANYEQRKKRKMFYRKNGYVSSGFGVRSEGVSYEIMVKGTGFTFAGCQYLLRRLLFGLSREKLYPL